MSIPELLIFDVNETMLDMSPLKSSINKTLENEQAFNIWFPTLLYYSLVETHTGNYNNFSDIALATLKMTGNKLKKEVGEEALKECLKKVRELPAYREVAEALQKLKAAGFKLVALSNGKPQVLKAQLKFAGIDSFFDQIISVEEVKAYKPDAGPYHYVLSKTGIPASRAMMIAAHSWDIIGAHRAGLQTAFIRRDGKSQYPLALKADHSLENFDGLVELFREK